MHKPEDQPVTPTGDAAQAYLPELDRQKKWAIEIANIQERLVSTMLQLDERQLTRLNRSLRFYQEKELMCIGTDGLFDGLGGDNVTFYHFFGSTQERIASVLGVKTANRLVMGISTDVNTREALRQYLIIDHPLLGKVPAIALTDNVETNLFFDLVGNYMKVIGLPKRIADPREQVALEGYELEDMHYVRAAMTPRDFVLAKTASTLLLQRAEQVAKSLSNV